MSVTKHIHLKILKALITLKRGGKKQCLIKKGVDILPVKEEEEGIGGREWHECILDYRPYENNRRTKRTDTRIGS